ncbi:methyltransferase domain-containing protein [Kibdelosporangium persicum]|uniref:Class I SAM-dependent methyltransferase n=1 Tax=Kibdelosporangium persicum TaxID=2698649 RepID=A0ABX2FH58_9PSEU|nr:methyltransferase domain-containing protein [Kibdelosporangium persicum]NRN70734.1 Class I SAM-dependent methyltransferase [Kibdelosporangium persicum]
MTDFDVALKSAECWLELASGERITLPVQQWLATQPSDEMLLAHCAGPTLDVGCGPGRLASALTSRGVPVLGVDVSPVAVRLTLARGAIALRRNVFDPLPGEGRWHSVLLADGNIGIGGDPVRLLNRIRRLLSRDGKVFVEIDPPGTGLRRQQVRVNGSGTWLPWAWLGADAVDETAGAAGFRPRWIAEGGDRWFTELVPR